jgi:DNA methylase
MMAQTQTLLFPDAATESGVADRTSSTFVDNMSLPVHRWFRFSAGFSAEWAKAVIRDAARDGAKRVLDPFAGSGTTLLAAEDVGVESAGVEAHPFVFRGAQGKLLRRGSVDDYLKLAKAVRGRAAKAAGAVPGYPDLIGKCYTPEALAKLHALRMAVEESASDSAAWQLVWLTLAGILRITSCVGTWKNRKRRVPLCEGRLWFDG